MKVRVGIIGTGWVTGLHLPALNKISEVELVAVAGRNVSRAQELAQKYGVKAYYEDYKAMLSKEKLDAVYILMPPDAHGKVEEDCAKSVPAVLIEKPICNSIELARKIQKSFEKNKTLVSVGYMNRYRHGIQHAKRLFSASENRPVLVNGWWVFEMPGAPWWRDMSRSGGQFVEQCTHLVDLARYIVGEITEVHAFAANGFIKDYQEHTIDDAMTVNVRFASGAVGNFVTGAFPRNGTDSQRSIGLTIASMKLKCEFSDWAMNLNALHGKDHSESIRPEEDIFEVQNRAFIKAIIKKDPTLILSSYSDAMKSLAVGCAANESARSGSAVVL